MIPNQHLSDPDYWHEELKPLLVDIDFAFQLAVPQANDFFHKWIKKSVNRPVHSVLIRYFVLEYLWAQKRVAVEIADDDQDAWGLEGLSNNGVEILFRGSRLRLRKGDDPPIPQTESSKHYYQQKLFGEGERDHGTVTNLLLLWNLSPSLEYQGKLQIVRPLGTRRKKVREDWRKTVCIQRVDASSQIRPDYVMPSELPLGAPAAGDERQRGTGTDG